MTSNHARAPLHTLQYTEQYFRNGKVRPRFAALNSETLATSCHRLPSGWLTRSCLTSKTLLFTSVMHDKQRYKRRHLPETERDTTSIAASALTTTRRIVLTDHHSLSARDIVALRSNRHPDAVTGFRPNDAHRFINCCHLGDVLGILRRRHCCCCCGCHR